MSTCITIRCFGTYCYRCDDPHHTPMRTGDRSRRRSRMLSSTSCPPSVEPPMTTGEIYPLSITLDAQLLPLSIWMLSYPLLVICHQSTSSICILKLGQSNQSCSYADQMKRPIDHNGVLWILHNHKYCTLSTAAADYVLACGRKYAFKC